MTAQPGRADMPALAEDRTGERLHAWVVEQIGIATNRLSVQGGRIHEGVRQARKAIRRARAALLLAGPGLGASAAALGRELRRTNRALSALRDAHALVDVIERLALKSHSHADTQALRRARRTAALARAAATRDPAHRTAIAEASEMLALTPPALAGLPWEQVGAALLVDALARTQRRVARLRRRASCSQDDDAWHRWRRGMRRQSQQRRACRALGVAVPDSGFDKSLAEQLGVLQDLSLLIGACGRGSIFAEPDRRRLRRFARRALKKQRKRIASVATGA